MTMPEGNKQNNRLSLKAADALDDLDSYLAGVSGDEDTDSTGSIEEHVHATISLRDLTDVCNKCKSVTFSITSAITQSHKQCLRALLGNMSTLKGCEVSAEDGTTPIHVAAKYGNTEFVELLLSKDNAMAEIKDARGATATHVLCYNGHHGCLSWLLKNGGSAAHKDLDGATPVHYAAASGHLECLQQLIQTGNGDPNVQTYSGETPVYFAAQEGHLHCVQWLVEMAKADPTSSSNDGMTPLHAAAQTGQVNVTHWLVRTAKCSVISKTCDGATPLHFAAAKGHVAILQWMLHHSLVTGDEADDFGATPVHDAAEQGQLESLKVFYEHSVNLDSQDCDGLTPRDLAEQGNHTRCIEFLKNPEEVYNKRKHSTPLVDVDAKMAARIKQIDTEKKRKGWNLFKKKESISK